MPGARHFGLVQIAVFRAKVSGRRAQAPDAKSRDEEGQRVEEECDLVAEGGYAGAAEVCADREGKPAGGLGQ